MKNRPSVSINRGIHDPSVQNGDSVFALRLSMLRLIRCDPAKPPSELALILESAYRLSGRHHERFPTAALSKELAGYGKERGVPEQDSRTPLVTLRETYQSRSEACSIHAERSDQDHEKWQPEGRPSWCSLEFSLPAPSAHFDLRCSGLFQLSLLFRGQTERVSGESNSAPSTCFKRAIS